MKFSKFLVIAFMCHQKPERSFHFRGRQFPLCARCTGILIGYFVGIAVAYITRKSNCLWLSLCVVPMIIDGGIQLICKAESNNFRRLITGILGRVGIIYLFVSLHTFTVWWVRKVLRYFMLLCICRGRVFV